MKNKQRRLAGGHGLDGISNVLVADRGFVIAYLGDNTLERKLLLLEVIAAGILNLELSHGVRERALNLLLLAALELHAHGWVRDDLLDSADVALQLLASLELLGESVVAGLELGGVVDHLLDLGAAELTDGVGNGDVGGAARALLGGGDLQDTVDVDLEDNLKDGLTGAHRWDWSKGELSEGGVVCIESQQLSSRSVSGDTYPRS